MDFNFPDIGKAITDLLAKPTSDRVEMDQSLISEYRNKITNAERYHKQKFVDAYAKRYLGYLEGKIGDKEFDGNYGSSFDPEKAYRIFCNEFYTCSEVLKPNLYFQNPHVTIESEIAFVEKQVPAVDLNGLPIIDAEGQPTMTTINVPPNTELVENVINSMLKSDTINWKQIAKKATATMIPLNFAVSKWGWNTEISGESMNLQLLTDEPVCEWFNPMNFLVDPEATRIDLKDAKYVIFRFHKSTKSIKDSKLYKGVANLKGTNTLQFTGNPSDSKFIADYQGNMTDLERSVLYEIWDMEHKRVVAFVDGLDYPIRDDDWLWGLKGYPCKILASGESLTGFYPTPDFRAYESLVMTKTLLVQKLTNLLIALNRSYIGDKSVLKDADARARVEDVDQAGIVWVDNPQGKDLGAFLKPLNDFAFSESYNEFIRMIDDNLQRLSGLADFQKGMITEAKRTATEIVGIQSGQNVRLEFKKDAIVDWTVENVYLLLELLQNNADKERTQKLIKDSGEEFIPWDKDAIQGKFAATIDMADMIQQNVEVKRKEAKERYNTGLTNPLIQQVEATKDFLKAEGVKDVTKKLNAAQVALYEAQAKAPMAAPATPPVAENTATAATAVPPTASQVTPTEAATETVVPPTAETPQGAL